MKGDNTIFQALVVEESKEGEYRLSLKKKAVKDLPPGDVLIRVKYSSLNYKDALSATGNKGVTRKYPHTPGIDAAGIVVESKNRKFNEGDKVLITGYDLGMNTCGGFEEYIRVPAAWIVPLPENLTLAESMVYGTAGFTAAMSIYELVQTLTPKDGDILVTGATGGVGSLAVSILVKLGYSVTCVTGKPEGARYLKKFGAKKVIKRDTFLDTSGRPLLKTSWAGVVDTVGGEILATAIKSVKPNGVITCCGNVASPTLLTTVFPFILRGVRLIGIDSQNCTMDHRLEIWNLLSGEWKVDNLKEFGEEIGLGLLKKHIDKILTGQQKGRVVVSLG